MPVMPEWSRIDAEIGWRFGGCLLQAELGA